MKNLFGFILLLSLTVMISCDKEADVNPVVAETELTSVTDNTSLDYLENDIDELVDALVETRDPMDCPTFSSEYPRGKFPNTFTIDFGDSCTTHNGHVRSGMIVIEQSARMNELGATRTVTFVDFSIDGIQIEGTKVLTNDNIDASGNVTLTRYAEITLTFPNGQQANRVSEYVMVQVAGAGTDERGDDIFHIDGETNGVNRNGDAFSSSIIEDLVKVIGCRWIVDGMATMEVVTEDGILTRTIDYGFPNGECDNKAEVTLPDGSTKIIRIHRRWW